MKTRITALAFCAILLFSQSCEKENMEISEQIPETTQISTKNSKSKNTNQKSFYVLGSAANPFNELGVLHNQILDDLRETYYPEMPRSEVYTIVADYVENNLGYSDIITTMVNEGYDTDVISYVPNSNFYTEVDGLFSNGWINSIQKSYFYELLDVCTSVQCTSCNLNQSVVIAIGKIKLIEEDILVNTSITNDEKDLLLRHIAFTKYSMDFWALEAQRTSTNYSIALLSNGGTGVDFVPGLPWYAKDAAGATTMLTTGGPTLLVVGGPAAVIGGTLLAGAFSSMF